MRKISLISFIVSILCFILSSSVFAISAGPSGTKATIKPGESYQGIVYTTNTGTEPVVTSIEQTDLIKDGSGDTEYSSTPLPKGLLQWTKFNTKQEATLNPSEKFDFKYTITVPKDAAPGTYIGGFLLSEGSLAEKPTDENGGSVGVKARVLSQLYLTVEGAYTEKLTMQKFEINKDSFLKGDIIFNIDLKNEGDVLEQPIGNITIYDEKNNQVKGIYPTVQVFDGQEVVTERKDEIPINPNNLTILPLATKSVQVPWTHRTVPLGKYTAKLNLFYGDKSEKIEGQTSFSLVDNFTINDFKAESVFNSSLPVKFSAKLQNIGTLPAIPTGSFAVNNIFGAQKFSINYTEKQLYMEGGAEKVLNNLVWDQGFALGMYNAVLSLNVNGQLYSKSITFWVINWWQIAIIVIILAAVVFFVYKGISGYHKMKKKLEKK